MGKLVGARVVGSGEGNREGRAVGRSDGEVVLATQLAAPDRLVDPEGHGKQVVNASTRSKTENETVRV